MRQPRCPAARVREELGDVTEGYIRPSVEHLREVIENVAAFLLEKAGVGEARKREVG